MRDGVTHLFHIKLVTSPGQEMLIWCLGVFGQVDPISKSNGGPIALDLGTLTMPVSIPRNERYRDNLVILTIPG